MDWIPVIIRFVSGGSLVVAATLLAEKYNSPYVGGLLLLFPSMTIASVYFVAKSSGNEVASKIVVGALLGLPVWILYAVVLYFLLKSIQLAPAIFYSFLVWIAGGLVFIYLKTRYL
ncbi:GlpM family protein [Candidatus Altiarchaeota archaeon]